MNESRTYLLTVLFSFNFKLNFNFVQARDESVYYAIMFGLLGIGSMLAMFLQGFMFGISGENLTLRLRREAFSAMLSQEMGWFDMKENSTGTIFMLSEEIDG